METEDGGVVERAELRGMQGGVGVRWLLLPKQRTTVRVDYAKWKSSSGLYVAFNEAF